MDNDIFFKPTDINHQHRLSVIFDHNNVDAVPKKTDEKINIKTYNDYDFQSNDSNTDEDMKNLSFLTTLDNTLTNQTSKSSSKFFDQPNQNYHIQYSNEFLNSSFIANGNKTNKASSELSFKSPNATDSTNSLNQLHLSTSLKEMLNKDLTNIEKNDTSINKTDFRDAADIKPKKIGNLRNSKLLQPPTVLPKRNIKRKISSTSDEMKKSKKKIKVKSLKDVINRPQLGNGMDFFKKFHLNYSINQITKNICQSDSTLISSQKYFKNGKNVNDFDCLIFGLDQDVEDYKNVCKQFENSHFN